MGIHEVAWWSLVISFAGLQRLHVVVREGFEAIFRGGFAPFVLHCFCPELRTKLFLVCTVWLYARHVQPVEGHSKG